MQILEDDRRTYKMMTTEQLEALSLQRIQDFEQYGDDPLMWDRARQFREIEAARAEEVAKKLAAGLSLAEVEAAAAAAKSSEAADDVYSTKVPIAVMDGDKPLSVSELHAITPFFHYYITHYDLRANPLSALLRFTRFWALHEPRGQKLSDSKRLAMIAAVYSNAHLAQALDESYRVQGVDSLTRAELVEANYQRGMRSEGADITDDVLRRQLTTWLELHSTGEMVLPGTLLMYAPLLISPEPMTPEAVTQAQELLAEAQTIAPRKE